MSKIRALLLILLAVPASLAAQQNLGPLTTPQVNTTYYAGSILYPTLQSAVTAACASTAGGVVRKGYGVTTTDTVAAVTGGCTKVEIIDQSVVFSNYYAWSGTAYVAGPQTINGALTLGGSLSVPVVTYTGQHEQGYVLSSYTATTTWVKLGTWVAVGGDSLRIQFDDGNGDNSNLNQQASATLLTRLGNNTTAPNLAGVTVYILGGATGAAPILQAVAQATGGSAAVGNLSWDIYVQVPGFAYGTYHVSLINGATWTDVQSTGTTPSTTPSTTVVPGSIRTLMDATGKTPLVLATGLQAGTVYQGAGLQFMTIAGCTITAGAVGNTCSNTLTPSPALNNTSGTVVCNITGPTGATVLSNATVASVTSVTVASYALSTTAIGRGTVNCISID